MVEMQILIQLYNIRSHQQMAIVPQGWLKSRPVSALGQRVCTKLH